MAPHKPLLPADAAVFHISFYKFVTLKEPQLIAATVKSLCEQHCLQGTVDVAFEGISGALAAPAHALNAFELALTTCADFLGLFKGMIFKRTACKSKPFHMLKVSHVPELIRIGLDPQTSHRVDATTPHGTPLDPQAWRELLMADDVVVIDNRNSFEFALGRFKGAIDPQVAHYRDFPKFIEENLPVWKAQKKRVAMYCTGGIRCDKTAAWMDTLDTQLDTPVYTLDGGIINYLAYMLDKSDAAQDWTGECFVFDNRMALDAQLQETDSDIEDIYDEARDGAWRIARAKRLSGRE